MVECNPIKGVVSLETALKRFLQGGAFFKILWKRKKGVFYRCF